MERPSEGRIKIIKLVKKNNKEGESNYFYGLSPFFLLNHFTNQINLINSQLETIPQSK